MNNNLFIHILTTVIAILFGFVVILGVYGVDLRKRHIQCLQDQVVKQ